jgi:hypothetical protein
MARKTDSMPTWLPFGLAGSFLVMLGAGARAGWRTPAEQPKPPPPPPSGSLQDWFNGSVRI